MTDPIDTPQIPRAEIDSIAPDFEARSTQGPLRLSDHRGRWVLLFSHPADFTPVCTSEFIAFQKAKPEFDALDCDLIGLSVDSVFAHLAWLRDIEARFGVRITFPVVEDISMVIARAYGMVHDASASTATVRSVFFIDPQGVIRAMVHYPMNVGRSTDELIRALTALREVEGNELSTPAGWQPGDAKVMAPPTSTDEIAERQSAHTSATDWYFTEVMSS